MKKPADLGGFDAHGNADYIVGAVHYREAVPRVFYLLKKQTNITTRTTTTATKKEKNTSPFLICYINYDVILNVGL